MNMNHLCEPEIELMLLRGYISSEDITPVLDHPEWRSFSPVLRSYLRLCLEEIGRDKMNHEHRNPVRETSHLSPGG